MKAESLQSARESIETEAAAVGRMAPALDLPAFAAAVEALAACPRIVTCASGHSGIAAAKFAHSLSCIERGAVFLPPCMAVHGGLGSLQRGDVMVMVSRGGKTAELLPILPVVRQRGATLLAVTENAASPLAEAADIVLPLRIDRESDPLRVMATSSFFATVALFDALLAALIVETGYTREQFGVIHPGGAVGAVLNPSQRSGG
jgi:D-arabinose 5-phosphate isomerase GutQ